MAPVNRLQILLVTLPVLTALLVTENTTANASDLAAEAHRVLKSRCYSCHGQKFSGNSQLDVLDVAGLVEQGYVIGGEANESYLWERIESGDMPPQSAEQLSESEASVIKRWISSGAPSIERNQRAMVSPREIVNLIHEDLLNTLSDDRPFRRYFSLVHLHNNTDAVSDKDLQVYRASLSKMLNSLSHRSEIYLPVAIDSAETIFRIDLRDLDWEPQQWTEMLKVYPYGFNFHHNEDQFLADRDRQIDELTGTSLCWMRADWFVSKASRSPLYEMLLKLPASLQELEDSLGVDSYKNFENNTAKRAGFTSSGVSTGHRVLERHRSRDGYYWKSFDFKSAGISRDAIRMPLGPQHPGNEFNRFAFEHDGGEVIFSLPNGLQGYMLVDSEGNRIDKAPIEIVRDSKETGGTPQVINAVSCIHCHRDGIIPFNDAVREGSGLFGKARVKTRQLYPKQEEMDQVVQRDRDRFLEALQQSTSPFLDHHQDASASDFQEPVGQMVRFFDRDLSRTDVAHELGLATEDLRIGRNEARLGLDPLNHNQRIKRQRWESLEMFVSPFQQTLQSMGLATPVR